MKTEIDIKTSGQRKRAKQQQAKTDHLNNIHAYAAYVPTDPEKLKSNQHSVLQRRDWINDVQAEEEERDRICKMLSQMYFGNGGPRSF